MKNTLETTKRFSFRGKERSVRTAGELPGQNSVARSMRDAKSRVLYARRQLASTGRAATVAGPFRRALREAALSTGYAPVDSLAGVVSRLAAESQVLDLRRGADEQKRTSRRAMGRVSRDDPGFPESILKGQPVWRALSDIARRQRADLMILHLPGAGRQRTRYARHLVRHAPCSICLIPAPSPVTIRRLCVAMDFSRESSRALSVAVKLAGLTGIAEIVCIHCYTVPVGNLSAGKRFLEMSEAMRDLAKGRLTRLLKRVNTAGVVTRCVIEQDRNPSDGIVRTAVREKADMIVVGTRGRKNLAAALLVPSVSEAIATKSPLPVLAVKLPGEGLTLRRAFMSL